jgi:potassium efflux system protein
MEGDGLRPSVTHSLVAALRAVPSLSALDDATLLGLVGDSANLVWTAGSFVFEKDSEADGLYIVLSGKVRIFDRQGRELSVLDAGDYFGEFSLLLGTTHQHDVEAVEDVELMVVPKERVEALLAANPELAGEIRRRLEERQAANAALASEGSSTSAAEPTL